MLFWGDLSDKIYFWNKSYTYFDAYMLIDSALEERANGDIFEKYELYRSLKKSTLTRYKQKDVLLYKQFADVLQIGINSLSYELESDVQEMVIGHSVQGEEILVYVKWVPENGYKLIVWNIHGSYEYGTYETSLMLLDELKTSKATGWIIIPSLNPDGLKEYREQWTYLNAYLEGRDNHNHVDLNRNFCSKNFILWEFEKYGKTMKTWTAWCASEPEVQAFLSLIDWREITHVLSLHSAGGIFYIPDGSLQDDTVIRFTKSIHALVPNYDFYPNTSSPLGLHQSIVRYEMDEGGKGLYTGTLENYMYENYGIPAVIIELANHGRVEERLKPLLHTKF